MTFAEAGFWFLLGFFVASWLAHKAARKHQANILRNFRKAKTEILGLIESCKELTEVRVTIVDGDGGEFTVKTSEADFEADELEIDKVVPIKPPKGLH